MGSEEIVRLLLKRGAEVNATGGQYENALIAAIVRGHEDIARILIKADADVLKEAGLYISPLYQVVSHSDVDMALLLLERGAWLSRNYGELLDLASERGNEEIYDLMQEYDVRDLRLKYQLRLGAVAIPNGVRSRTGVRRARETEEVDVRPGRIKLQ